MFGILALLIGAGQGAMDGQRRCEARAKAKREGQPYYFHGSKRYATDNDEVLTFHTGALWGAKSGRLVWSPLKDKLRRANESCQRQGKKYHYEENWGGYHNSNGWIKVENSTGKAIKLEYDGKISCREKTRTNWKLYYIDRETGERISDIRYLNWGDESGKYL